MREALAKLEPEEREILMLREYEQLSYQEMAHVLVPLNTVRSRLFRARGAMRHVLGNGAENWYMANVNHPFEPLDIQAWVSRRLAAQEAKVVEAHVEACVNAMTSLRRFIQCRPR